MSKERVSKRKIRFIGNVNFSGESLLLPPKVASAKTLSAAILQEITFLRGT